MEKFSIRIKPQFVKLTDEKESFPNGVESFLHEVQKRMKLDFDNFPEFTIITAPTGTGKSYAFPFPVINYKMNPKPFDKGKVRGLIVLPTNALIEELTKNFTTTYPFLKINKITGKTLDEFSVKGFDRWLKVIELCKGDTDLVITNPDIINYAMHGGYHQNTWQKIGRKEFHNFLECFGYIIFDEYHLYNESQIANLLTLIYLRDIFLNQNNRIKFLFVSATPEKALKEILTTKGYVVEEIIEKIVDDTLNVRAIHGAIDVDISYTSDISSSVFEHIKEINMVLESGKRVLIVLDRLNEVQLLAQKLASYFHNYSIYQNTGYISKEESQQLKIDKANIIISTNKAEVGVNYDVEYCIMQPGKYYQNLIQRFGRVSRGNLDGKIIIYFDNVKYNSLKRTFKGLNAIPYYEFLDKLQSVIQSKKFYSERVPYYQGEYVWCIEKNLKLQKGGYNSYQYFKKMLIEENFFKNKEAYSRYKLFSDIDKCIQSLNKAFPNGPTAKAWTDWWKNYLNTFLCFRDNSLVVQIFDRSLNIELVYSLEWILQYKEILHIEDIKHEKYSIRKYIVGNIKNRDKDIQYQVNTIPSIGAKENEFLTHNQIYDLSTEFVKRITNLITKRKIGVEQIDKKQIELLKLVMQLSTTFDRMRLGIITIEGNNNYY